MLKSISYSQYIKEIISLARSIRIKHNQTINSINDHLMLMGETLSSDPLDWKYYQNINGNYYLSDSPMTIISIDTQAPIPFTKDILAEHPLTHYTYQLKGTYYRSLLQKYPDNTLLIDGIIEPIDPQFVLDASDYTMLSWDTRLLADNEVTIMADLQAWIYRFKDRWDVSSFTVTDPLYSTSFISVLYLNIVPILINLRLARCKTNEVSQWHLWAYLGGYFKFDRYRDIIPLDVALFLYKNIEYIISNTGKSFILDWLDNAIAKPNGIILSKYDLIQRLRQPPNVLTHKGPFKEIGFKEFSLSDGDSIDITGSIGDTSVSDMVLSMKQAGQSNEQYITKDQLELQTLSRQTSTTSAPTKTIGCSNVVTSTAYRINTATERIKFFLYLSNLGLYLDPVTVPWTTVGGVDLTLKGDEAAAILLYIANKPIRNDLTNILELRITDILHPVPSGYNVEDLRGYCQEETLNVSYEVANQNGITVITHDLLPDITDDIPTPIPIGTKLEFTTFIDRVISRRMRHTLVPSLTKGSLGRSEIRDITNAFYVPVDCTFTQHGTYENLFNHLQIDPSTLSAHQLNVVLEVILSHIGVPTEISKGLASPQLEIVDIIRQLTSYTVTLVNDNVINNIIPMEHPFIRYDAHVFALTRYMYTVYLSLDYCAMIQGWQIDTDISIQEWVALNYCNLTKLKIGVDIDHGLDVCVNPHSVINVSLFLTTVNYTVTL